ncbi:DNA double-strand break repair nuclease NurA [Bacillus mexicanus]|uniref:DNA double-strand break repair nuclease NurA n=1 Tax=Bacillus mexicanus TaxID=2834415 RepID=UPI003D23AD40
MSFYIDQNSLRRSAQFLENVRGQLKTDSETNDIYQFKTFKAKNHTNILASIDGSHHSVKGKSFVFSAINSGFQLYQSEKLILTEKSRTKIEILTKDNYKKRHAEYYINVTGQRPQRNLDFEKSTERIRTLLEWDKVKYLISILNKGDIILFDGSMISGVISTNKLFFENLCEQAKQKGIILAGLSKDTSLLKDNVPVPMILSAQSLKQKIDSNWYFYYEEEDTYFVKFRKHIDLIFRLDLVLPKGISEEEVIKFIGSYCFNKGNQGYPYPLQWIHDEVRISQQQFLHCLEEFKIECRKRGIPKSFVDELFTIYHDQLDVMSFGR